MPGAGDAKRGSGVWGPPGATPGICMVGNDHPARSARAFYCEEHRPGATPNNTASVNGTFENLGSGFPEPEESDGGEEVRPTSASTSPTAAPLKGIRRLWGSAKGSSPSPSTTTERRPATPKPRRVSTADFWGDTVVGAGSAIVAKNGYVPTSRAMMYSAPVAGEIIEGVTKDTIVDRMVQPICRNAQKWEDLFDLVGLWVAIGVAEKDPVHAQQAIEFAKKRMVNLLPRIAKKIKEERKKEDEAVQALLDLDPEIEALFPDAPPGTNKLDLLMASLFRLPEGVSEQEFEFFSST